MKRAYNPHLIEPKWRGAWDRAGCDRAPDLPDGPKFFNYDSGPFPNGPLHMGHVRTYVLGDVTARYQRLLGRSVLYATEWDAFGLPNELEALAEGTDPRTFTRRYIRQMRAQMRRLGISYDYARIRNTSDPAYYRWTQWLFLELHERGLVEQREAELSWCPSCRTALGTMQIERGACWRCGTGVEVRRLPQWFVDLSRHAESAERELDGLDGWSDRARNGLRAAMTRSGRTTAWLVSRQRAWGTPIPIVRCGSCGVVPVPREQLPVHPGPPETTCPRCGGEARRETDTLDCFFDDVWCFYSSLVPIDRADATVFPSPEVDAWMPMDRFHSGYDTLIYLHLHRVIARVLAESGHVRDAEPVRGYFGHDLVLSRGRKMSKHLGNAVAPLKLLRSYGADAVRVAVLWAAGPPRTIEWSPRHMSRAVDFLDGFYRLCVRFPTPGPDEAPSATRAAKALDARTAETFVEVARYLEDYRPNAALERLASALKSIEDFLSPREAGRLAADDRTVVSGILRRFAIALAPFAPHLAEEASEKMGHPPFAVRARWPSRIAQLLLAFALATGCSAHHPATTAGSPAPAPRTDEGISKATYIFDPANPALHLADDVQFDRPWPDDANALPVYPEHALRENAGTHREVVRIVIDTTGKVSEVLDSPLEASEDGPYAADFRGAVDTTVRSWRFQPGHLRNVVPGNDVDGDGKIDYKVTTSIRPIAVYYDVRFTFEIVDGRGVVTPK